MVSVSRSIEIGSTPVQLVEYVKNRTSLALFNTSPTWIVYIGADRTVNITNGFLFERQTGLQFNKGLGDRPDLEIWATTSGGVADVRIWESFEELEEEEI